MTLDQTSGQRKPATMNQAGDLQRQVSQKGDSF